MRFRSNPIFLAAALVLFVTAAIPCHAVTVPERPRNYVVDLAGIIKSPVERNLNRYLQELEQKTTAQFLILTIKSLEGESIDDFSIGVAHDKWKLGQKGKDNGVLLVVSLQDKKYRIEVGYGLEGVLPDSLVGSIGRSSLVPSFRAGDYSKGIYTAGLIIANEIARDAGVEIAGMPKTRSPVRGPQRRKPGLFNSIFSLIIFIFMAILFIRNPKLFLVFLLFSSMGGRRGSWGGGGGGFGGGGGGGFGGGGASGGW